MRNPKKNDLKIYISTLDRLNNYFSLIFLLFQKHCLNPNISFLKRLKTQFTVYFEYMYISKFFLYVIWHEESKKTIYKFISPL